MLRGKIYSTAVLSCVVAGCFVCSPVFAENPVKIDIVEVVEDGSGGYKAWEDITGAMPGMSYSAIPRVRNDGKVPVRVRMCLAESATNAADETITLPANTFGININSRWTLDDEATTDVTDPAAGNCYKYDSEVAVGSMTEPLFTEVSLSSELGNEYQGATFGLHLEADAVGDALPEPTPPNSPDTGEFTGIFGTVSVRDFVCYTMVAAVVVTLGIYIFRTIRRKK